MYFIDVNSPGTITNVSFFLYQALPQGSAAALYYSAPPYNDLQFIGAIANERPSDIFHTGFATKPDVNEQSTIKLVIRIQEISQIADLVKLSQQNDVQKNYSKLVAKNLYNFMLSKNQSQILQMNQQDSFLVLPQNVLDQWLQKFDMKYQIDPNFIYKTE